MDLLNIITYPDTFLSTNAKPVENIDGALQQLIDDMSTTMYQACGIGLASVQVGVDKRLIIIDARQILDAGEEKNSPLILINPTIVAAEGSVISENEGCLSVPDFRANVKRHQSVAVEGFDRHGKPVRMERDDFLAIVLQHEIDHLNGTLFIDRLSSLKRQMYKRKVKKQLKRDGQS